MRHHSHRVHPSFSHGSRRARRSTLPVTVTVFDSPEGSITCEEANARERFRLRVFPPNTVPEGRRAAVAWPGAVMHLPNKVDRRPATPQQCQLVPNYLRSRRSAHMRLSALRHVHTHKGGARFTCARTRAVQRARVRRCD